MALSPEVSLLIALLFLAGLVALLAVVLTLGLGRRRAADSSQGLGLLQQQLDALRSELARHVEHQSERLEHAQDTMGHRLLEASHSVAEVREQLGILQQATHRVIEVGKSVVNIENLLRAPKLRGVLGESFLAEILKQALPTALFELQHAFPGGERVDAIVRIGDSLLPVDAKFPLDNLRRSLEAESESEALSFRRAFARDFRKHVDDVARKYIRPEQGTLSLAFLYIPAESVYHDAVLGDWPLAEYALSRRVIPTGPLGFYAFLQTVVLGARAIAVPHQAKAILAGLDQMALELEQVEEEMARLARHLELARSTAGQAGRRIEGLTETLDRARTGLADPTVSRAQSSDVD